MSEHPIRADRIVLGRQAECDVVVTANGVSRRHAELTRTDGAWWVTDLGSSNGSFVNDRPIERERLAPGDVLRLGPSVEVEILEEHRAEPPPRASRTDARTPASAPGPSLPWWRQRSWRLEPRARGASTLEVRGAVTTVGRDPGSGFVLDDESVSRVHARLDRRGATLAVTDLKTANGTRLNGEPVLQAEVADGDALAFGEVEFRVRGVDGPAWRRLAALAVATVVAGIAVLGALRLSDALRERGELGEAASRVRIQALDGVRLGIAASRAGDAEMARTHLVRAADLLLLSDLAPRGATLERPALLFREILADLPEDEREFDVARALDADAVANSRARLATLSNREYVEHQVRRYAVELGQDADVPSGFVDQVWGFVSEYERYRGGMQIMLRRSVDLMPRIRQILASRHLPEAFGYVPWVESALDPTQRSPVGALGLWQFMPATGREYGLHVDAADPARDERTHVERSTAAAADYIATMLRDQGPEYFMLVLAAYNRGHNAIDRAKQRVADPMLAAHRKYWYLVEHGLLPEETRNYVPKIFAVRVIAEAPERFGFEAP